MKKKILTLLVVGVLLIGISGIGTAYACSRQTDTDNAQGTCNQFENQSENADTSNHSKDGSNISKANHSDDEVKQPRGRSAISAYSAFSGMAEQEILEYLNENNCTLNELATENGHLQDFLDKIQEEEQCTKY